MVAAAASINDGDADAEDDTEADAEADAEFVAASVLPRDAEALRSRDGVLEREREPVAVVVAELDPELDEDAVAELDPELEEDAVEERVRVAERVLVRVQVVDDVRVPERDLERERVGDAVLVIVIEEDDEAEPLDVADEDADAEAVDDRVRERDTERLVVGERDGERVEGVDVKTEKLAAEFEGDAERLGEPDDDAEGDVVVLRDGEDRREADALRVRERVIEADGVPNDARIKEGVRVAELDADVVAEPEALPDTLAEFEIDAESDTDADAVAEAEAEGERDRDAERLRVEPRLRLAVAESCTGELPTVGDVEGNCNGDGTGEARRDEVNDRDDVSWRVCEGSDAGDAGESGEEGEEGGGGGRGTLIRLLHFSTSLATAPDADADAVDELDAGSPREGDAAR